MCIKPLFPWHGSGFRAAASLIACALVGCGSQSSVQHVTTPFPSSPSTPISTSATNPAVVAKTLYVSANGTVPGIYEFAANANGDVNPAAFIGSSFMGYGALPDAVATDASGNLYELISESGLVLGLPTGVYGLMCEYSSGGTPIGSCASRGVSALGGSIAVDQKSGSVFVLEGNGLIEKFGSAPTTITTLNSLYSAPNALSGVGIGIALDASGNLYAAVNTSSTTGSVFMFPAGSTGAAIPTQVIPSAYTPRGIALDSAGNLYISQYPGTSSSAPPTGIYEFAAGSTTSSTPIRSISGAATTIYTITEDAYLPIAVDAADNVFLSNVASGLPASILVFSSTATGNVAPASTISSTSFVYASSLWLQ